MSIKNEGKKKKNLLIAQTTHLASFGPVFVITPLRCLFRTSNTLVAPKTVVSDNKKLKEIEKKLTNGLNDTDTSFGPVFVIAALRRQFRTNR
jgi:hypothetical protein